MGEYPAALQLLESCTWVVAPPTPSGRQAFGSNPLRDKNASHLLSQPRHSRGKRLLCHCPRGSPCHVDVPLSCHRRCWRCTLSRTYADALDVIEVCDWGELIASGNHEGTENSPRTVHVLSSVPVPGQRSGASFADPRLSGTRSTACKARSVPLPTIFTRRHHTVDMAFEPGVGKKMDAHPGRTLGALSSEGMNGCSEVWRCVHLCQDPPLLRTDLRVPEGGRQISLCEDFFCTLNLPHVNTSPAVMAKWCWSGVEPIMVEASEACCSRLLRLQRVASPGSWTWEATSTTTPLGLQLHIPGRREPPCSWLSPS